MTQREFVEYVACQAKAIGSVNSASRIWGMSQAYLNAVVNHTRKPGPKVLRALGYEVVVDYRKKRTAAGGPDGDNV